MVDSTRNDGDMEGMVQEAFQEGRGSCTDKEPTYIAYALCVMGCRIKVVI